MWYIYFKYINLDIYFNDIWVKHLPQLEIIEVNVLSRFNCYKCVNIYLCICIFEAKVLIVYYWGIGFNKILLR